LYILSGGSDLLLSNPIVEVVLLFNSEAPSAFITYKSIHDIRQDMHLVNLKAEILYSHTFADGQEMVMR
jgi:hypothetical protein